MPEGHNILTDPEPNLNGRSVPIPRGKTLGAPDGRPSGPFRGSINGMVYVRGNPLDYDTWSQFGNRGWSYDAVLPYFKKSEHYEPGVAPRESEPGYSGDHLPRRRKYALQHRL